jgi:Domain of unknown function (DUF397)
MNSGKDFDDWRKASFSNASGSCVETASLAGSVAVRDTTNRQGGALVFTADTWRAFTGKARGEN